MGKSSSFFLFQDGQPHGPFSKHEIEKSVLMGELPIETLYSYDRARAWRPLTHLLGEINPQVIEDNRKKYYIVLNGESCGPLSYNELHEMIRVGHINHRTLFVRAGEAEWQPLARMPLPRIPACDPREGIPHESEWRKQTPPTLSGTGSGVKITIQVGSYWTDDEYYIWQAHSPKSSVAGQMFISGPVRLECLRELLRNGEVRRDTICAKSGSGEWLTVRDYV